MKSNAPWSVKGIERDAREAAKAAAQREGMTVGEWLNQIIYTAGDPHAAPTVGEIEGLKARDLAAAIEHLSRRISVADSRSAEAIDTLARSLGGAVERLQRLERSEPGLGAIDESLAARLRALEEKSTDRQRIEALRALERAVGQIAVQFNSTTQSTSQRLDSAERQLQDLAGRLETSAGPAETVSAAAVRDAIEGMAERVARAEKIAAEAAQLKSEAGESVDADFIHKTGIRLRILGDEIKRGGDQIRTLEQTISRLGQQIDAAERRSAEGVQKVAETITDLRSQLSSADAADQANARAEIEAAVSEITQRTEDRIQTLQESFDAMVRRLESAGGGAPHPIAAPRAAAALDAAPAPKAASAPIDDLDSELEDAFAALELEDPIPTPPAREPVARVEPELDDFAFDADEDELPEAAAEEPVDPETADVLAEIREAFGLGEPGAASEPADARADAAPEQEIEVAVEAPVEPPPLAAAADAAGGSADADYLKAARRAAREAAARAAEEEQAGAKRKLTPKQRAILAARVKRRKLEEANAKAAAEKLAADSVPPPVDEEEALEGAAGAIKARVKALVAKIKSRPMAKPGAEPTFDAFSEDAPATSRSARRGRARARARRARGRRGRRPPIRAF